MRTRRKKDQSPSKDDFLWRRVENLAAEAGLAVTPQCAEHLRAFITTGVNRMEHENDGRGMFEAERNLEQFVRGMIDYARRRDWPELREGTFFAAKEFFCPSWPFC